MSSFKDGLLQTIIYNWHPHNLIKLGDLNGNTDDVAHGTAPDVMLTTGCHGDSRGTGVAGPVGQQLVLKRGAARKLSRTRLRKCIIHAANTNFNN